MFLLFLIFLVQNYEIEKKKRTESFFYFVERENKNIFFLKKLFKPDFFFIIIIQANFLFFPFNVIDLNFIRLRKKWF